jgi:hypothetical protein
MEKDNSVDHQFSLFGFQPPKGIPKEVKKVSAERIREAKALMAKGDGKGAAEKMSEVREALESYLDRISNK